MLSQDKILEALKAVKYPGYSRDIVSFGLVKEISAANGAVSVTLQLTSANPEAARQIKVDAEQVLKQLPGVNQACGGSPAGGRPGRPGVGAPGKDQGARGAARDCRGQRQGRRGQIHLFGEPGLRPPASWRPGGPARLRYLRSQHSA